jgi:hypothetical protein
MQLHTADGFRGINCANCGKLERCSHNHCQCGTIWHHCPTHRIDPTTHRSRRGPNLSGAKVSKMMPKLCPWRHAPQIICTSTAQPAQKRARKSSQCAFKANLLRFVVCHAVNEPEVCTVLRRPCTAIRERIRKRASSASSAVHTEQYKSRKISTNLLCM